MNRSFFTLVSLATIAWAATLPTGALGQSKQASQSTRPVMRDSATHDSLVSKLRSVRQTKPEESLKPAVVEEISTKIPKRDLISESEVISFNGAATLVPKNAIISIPERYKSRIGWKPGSDLINWSDFYAKNQTWISTVEIDFEQARGNKGLDDATTEWMEKSSRMVVATFQKGPVSMLPAKAEPANLNGEQ